MLQFNTNDEKDYFAYFMSLDPNNETSLQVAIMKKVWGKL